MPRNYKRKKEETSEGVMKNAIAAVQSGQSGRSAACDLLKKLFITLFLSFILVIFF